MEKSIAAREAQVRRLLAKIDGALCKSRRTGDYMIIDAYRNIVLVEAATLEQAEAVAVAGEDWVL